MELSKEVELKFKKIVDQATSDTESPLTILLIVAQQCSGFPKEKVFELLGIYALIVPIPLYWINVDSIIIGGNEHIIAAIGGTTAGDYIGKPIYNFYPCEMAESMTQHSNEVMRTGKVIYQRAAMRDAKTGEIKHLNAYKAPLFDDNKNVIGLVGASVDITMEKDSERLMLKAKMQQGEAKKHRQCQDILKKMKHDAFSLLASMSMCLQTNQNEIPEKVINALFFSIEEIKNVINKTLGKANLD